MQISYCATVAKWWRTTTHHTLNPDSILINVRHMSQVTWIFLPNSAVSHHVILWMSAKFFEEHPFPVHRLAAWERIAEQLPWKIESCEWGVRAFALLTIYELTTYHEGIHLWYSVLLFWTLHKEGRDTVSADTPQRRVCTYAMWTNAEHFIHPYTWCLTAANLSRVVWNLLGLERKKNCGA